MLFYGRVLIHKCKVINEYESVDTQNTLQCQMSALNNKGKETEKKFKTQALISLCC
jgi:hypothetical protein